MNIVQIIDKKRRGETHTEEEIRFLTDGMMAGEVHDYQVAAWLMAACINGLDLEETTWLTKAFVESGEQLDLSKVDGVVVDKHSTGGVGDKTTLVLIPLLAASGVKVAKLSGRGLGFTGGTIDKLEAIPNFKTALTNKEFIKQIQKIGVAISGQTTDLAPADGKMYALRDVTATVQSIPLIAASVVSKKIAAGAQVIVLDIKYGRGAFMENLEDAKALAYTCREVGKRLGRSLSTVISSMEQPLGFAIGHTVEVIEAIKTLKGEGPEDLEELCLTLGGTTLVGAGLAKTLDEAKQKLKTHLTDGSAFEKFQELVKSQGGEVEALTDFSLMPQPDRIHMMPASQSGTIAAIDSLKVAQAAKEVGAGRLTKSDPINLGVGVILHKKVGEQVSEGERLVELYCSDKNMQAALDLLEEAFTFSEAPVPAPPLVDEIFLTTAEEVAVAK